MVFFWWEPQLSRDRSFIVDVVLRKYPTLTPAFSAEFLLWTNRVCFGIYVGVAPNGLHRDPNIHAWKYHENRTLWRLVFTTHMEAQVQQVPSDKTLEEIDQALRDSISRHKYGVLAVHNLRDTMQKKGGELAYDCVIYEVCNPQQAKKALEKNGAISAALPCRISVYGSPGAYNLATIAPTAMMGLFKEPELLDIATEVERTVLEIMHESA